MYKIFYGPKVSFSLSIFCPSKSLSMSISFSLSFSLRESVSAFGNSIIMALKGKDGEKGKNNEYWKHFFQKRKLYTVYYLPRGPLFCTSSPIFVIPYILVCWLGGSYLQEGSKKVSLSLDVQISSYPWRRLQKTLKIPN